MNKRLLKVTDVSSQLNVSKSAVYSLVQRGALPIYKIGKCLRFEQIDIDKYLSKQRIKVTLLSEGNQNDWDPTI